MEKTIHQARNGWQPEETAQLWQEIRQAAETGAPLRGVFEKMGEALGRKPNSVRNYYYMQLRDQGGDLLKRAAPFETFTEDEVRALVRQVLLARGRGQSVRACVMDMSKGDKALMLRYQNKYRAVLRKRPELIEQVCGELAGEGESYLNPLAAKPHAQEEPSFGDIPNDPDVRQALGALASLMRRLQEARQEGRDRMRVQRDMALMRLEDVQLAAREMVLSCKNFLGLPPEERAAELPAFCSEITAHIARLESTAG